MTNYSLDKYSAEQLQALAENPKATASLRQAAKARLKEVGTQAVPTSAEPNFDPLTGQPTGGAPGAMVNFVPSAVNYGNDLMQGIGAMATDPLGTLGGIPQGIAEHYGSRYNSPSQAWQTFNADPVGAMADLSPVGGAINILGKVGRMPRMAAAGRNMERMDPATLAMGAGQLAVGEGMNRIPSIPSAEEVMAGRYGIPRGRQREDLPGYLNTVGEAMDLNLAPDVAGATRANELRSQTGAEIAQLIDDMDQSGMQMFRQDILDKLEGLKTTSDLTAQAPFRTAIDQIIADISRGDGPVISQREVQRIKQAYAGLVNYDSGTPPVDRLTQEGYHAGSGVLREAQRDFPGMEDALDKYGRASAVSDIVGRGAAKDVSSSGGGFDKHLNLGGAVDALAPLMTGQGALKRNQIRRDLTQGDYWGAITGATDPTIYNRLRQGALVSEMSDERSNDQWHVGRLWE